MPSWGFVLAFGSNKLYLHTSINRSGIVSNISMHVCITSFLGRLLCPDAGEGPWSLCAAGLFLRPQLACVYDVCVCTRRGVYCMRKFPGLPEKKQTTKRATAPGSGPLLMEGEDIAGSNE